MAHLGLFGYTQEVYSYGFVGIKRDDQLVRIHTSVELFHFKLERTVVHRLISKVSSVNSVPVHYNCGDGLLHVCYCCFYQH